MDSCITPAQELRNLSWDGGFALITLAAFYGYVYRRPLLRPAIWKFGFVALTTLGIYRLCGGTLACRLGAIVGQPLDALTAEFVLTAATWIAYSAVLYVVLFLYAFRSRNLWIGGGRSRA